MASKPNRKRSLNYSCRVTAEELIEFRRMEQQLGACSVREAIAAAYKVAEADLDAAQKIVAKMHADESKVVESDED